MKQELKSIFSSVFILFATLFFGVLTNLNAGTTAKTIYASYSSVPKVVYTKQRFSVTIQAKILLRTSKYKISTFINDKKSSLKLLTKDIIWYKKSDNVYRTTLQFKVLKDKAVIPKITISVLNNNNSVLGRTYLSSKRITYRKIAINKDKYSNIIASDLNVKNIKTKQYTNKELIHVLSIKATNSNLEEFHISKFKNQGVKVLDSTKNEQMLYYFVITPIGQRAISFNYFNTAQNKFININLPISIKEELVSTQTDLNPYENDMKIYKSIAVSVVVLFFLMMYYFTREYFYLFFTVITMTFLIYMLYPNKTIEIKSNTKVYILPTANSTVFSILKEKQKAQILIEKEKFLKILFKNNSVGWIKNVKN
jgi:hypothetical protein